MAIIRINSRLAHFKLLSGISRISSGGIRGEADLDRMPVFSGLEAMAQLAAMHVRFHLKFERHAFLLKVNGGRWPEQGAMAGRYQLSAALYGRSTDAYAYRVDAQGPAGMKLNADLLIGTKPYDDQFRQDLLKAHYRQLFEELKYHVF